MPVVGSITGFGYGRWQSGNVPYNSIGIAQWGIFSDAVASAGTDRFHAAVSDVNNNMYICGYTDQNLNGNTLFWDASGYAQALSRFSTTNIGNFTKGTIVSYTPDGKCRWNAIFGITGAGQVNYDIAYDGSQNLYFTGATSAAGPRGWDSSGTGIRSNAGFILNSFNRAAYVCKMNTDGKYQWVAGFGATSNNSCNIESVRCALDSQCNVYISGYYGLIGTAGVRNIFDASGITQSNSLYTLPFTSTITSNTYFRFLIKYNQNGKVQWSTYTPAATSNSFFGGLAVDHNDNVYMGITYQSTGVITLIDASGFTQSNSLFTIDPSGTTQSAALIKYNSDGKVQWCTTLLANSDRDSRSITVDSANNVYWVGLYRSNTGGNIIVRDASGTTQSNSLITLGNTVTATDPSIYVIKYNPDGKTIWATRCDQRNTIEGVTRSGMDSLNNLYLTGFAIANVRFTMYNVFGNSQISSVYGFTASASNNAAFLVKYNSNGIAQWATFANASGNDSSYGIGVDNSNSVYLTGEFIGSGRPVNVYDVFGITQVLSPVVLSTPTTTNSVAGMVKFR